MQHLFFSIDKDITIIAETIFNKLLGVEGDIKEGDSVNVAGGVYYFYSFFGVVIKLECNSYAYDNQYNFMLTVKKDILSPIESDDIIVDELANIIIRLLTKYLDFEVVYEDKEGTLRVYNNSLLRAF